MKDRNFKVSLVEGVNPSIVRVTTFREIVKSMLKDDSMIKTGDYLAKLYKDRPEEYKQLKLQQNGFVIGEFSHRNTDSCISVPSVIGLDVDHIGTEKDYEEIGKKLRNWPYSFVVTPSLSKSGYRVLVYTDTDDKAENPTYTRMACKSLSIFLKIPLKSEIREGLQKAGMSRDAIKAHLDENQHIDDVTVDLARFWFYSGLYTNEFFTNQESRVYSIKQAQPASTGDKDYIYAFTHQDKVDYLVNKIVAERVDITAGFQTWYKLGHSLLSEFSDSVAEDYFLRISQFHPDYKEKECKKEWQRVVAKNNPGRVNIETFYRFAKEVGRIEIDYKELKELHSDKFIAARAAPIRSGSDKKMKKKEAKRLDLFEKELERSIIGACIYEPDLFDMIYDVCPKFSPSTFFDYECGRVFAIMLEIRSEQKRVSPLVVQSKARYEKTPIDLDHFSKYDTTPDIFISHVRIAYSLYVKREIIQRVNEKVENLQSSDIDVFEFLQGFTGVLNELADFGQTRTEYTGKTISDKVREQFEAVRLRLKSNANALTGLATGLRVEDIHTSGYQKSDLIVLAARPGMGKTAKALKTMLVNALAGIPVGFFSLEMSAAQLARRLVSISHGVRLELMRSGKMVGDEFDSFIKGLDVLSDLPIFIDDKGRANWAHIEMTARKWKRKHGIQMLIIDYLQLIGTDNHKLSRHLQLGEMTRSAKALAKSLDIPVILLSQFSRGPESRGHNHRPQLSDLRESGNIEEDADIVEAIYRDEYYNIMKDKEGHSTEGMAEIIYLKHRNGGLGTLKCFFRKEFTDFTDTENIAIASQGVSGMATSLPSAEYFADAEIDHCMNDDDIPF